MFKRATSIFLILLVNFITLAHAVVSHHHHNSLVCFKEQSCQDIHQESDHHQEDHKHSNELNTCALKQAVVLPSNDIKLKCNSFDYRKDYHNFYSNLFYSKSDNSTIVPSIILAKHPNRKSTYFNLLTNSLGLRAPPIV